jgi:hypothetical protein
VEQLRAAPASEVLGPANALDVLAGLTGGVDKLLHTGSAEALYKRQGLITRFSDAMTPAAGRVARSGADGDVLNGTEDMTSPGGDSQGAEVGGS